MLKRARCTLYLAQESDTLGEDSELASTLAQGKPVIAFVPVPESGVADRLLNNLRASNPGISDVDLLVGQLQVFAPSAAWRESEVRGWVSDPAAAARDIEAVKARLSRCRDAAHTKNVPRC